MRNVYDHSLIFNLFVTINAYADARWQGNTKTILTI
jgi:hypothetical protein